ncbi:MAG: ABC transporter permease subunit [Deltaproteobacteria bacterium]|nr:ABC transporter permease subunit [Deltaproteobacteria bacterium]
MKFLVVCRRELRSYFSSYIAYVLLAVFLLLTGGFFYSWLRYFILFGGFVLPSGLWQQVYLDMRYCAMIVLPLLTMRLFSEEKKLGTIELLWTYPVSDIEVLAGKFLAAWLFYLLMLLPTAVGPFIFYHFYPFALAPFLSGYLGMVLLGTAFIACGIFVSCLTENQVVSAMGTYAILIFFWYVTWNEAVAGIDVVHILLKLSLFDRFLNFARGVIDTQDIAFFVLFIFFFLFLSLQSLGARKWRGVSTGI